MISNHDRLILLSPVSPASHRKPSTMPKTKGQKSKGEGKASITVLTSTEPKVPGRKEEGRSTKSRSESGPSVTQDTAPARPKARPKGQHKWTTNVNEVTGPVMSMVHNAMTEAWTINKHLPMWLVFDSVNPVRQFKRGMAFNSHVDFPEYGPPPWTELTETDQPLPGLMPYAPIAHQ